MASARPIFLFSPSTVLPLLLLLLLASLAAAERSTLTKPYTNYSKVCFASALGTYHSMHCLLEDPDDSSFFEIFPDVFDGTPRVSLCSFSYIPFLLIFVKYLFVVFGPIPRGHYSVYSDSVFFNIL